MTIQGSPSAAPSPAPAISPAVRLQAKAKTIVVLLFVFVILAWAFTWVAMKIAVREVTPFWAVAMRSAMAAGVIVPCAIASRQLVRPSRRDWILILVIALFHMSAFAALMTAGLIHVPAGRAIVLGYSTPLWVAPASAVFLGERLNLRKVVGVLIGVGGLLLLAGPGAVDWSSRDAVLGNGLPILAALFWAVSIVYTRAHRWESTPFQLLPWQCLTATVALCIVALTIEGPPPMKLGSATLLALGYNGIIGTALGYWAMAIVSRHLSATTVSLGLLATPVCGVAMAALFIGESLDLVLIASALMVTVGVAIGIQAKRST